MVVKDEEAKVFIDVNGMNLLRTLASSQAGCM